MASVVVAWRRRFPFPVLLVVMAAVLGCYLAGFGGSAGPLVALALYTVAVSQPWWWAAGGGLAVAFAVALAVGTGGPETGRNRRIWSGRPPRWLSLGWSSDLAAAPGTTASLPALLRPGSPVLYFVPSGPLTVAAALGALVAGWRSPNRHWLTVSAAATVTMALGTAELNRTVNEPLFLTARAPDDTERTALLRRWYRVNAIRMAVLAVGWGAAQGARSRD